MSTIPDSVGTLLEHIGHGDEEAIDTLLRKYRPYLRVLAQRAMRQMFAHKFDASDAVQQTCLEAFNAISQFRGKSAAEFNGWISTILDRNLKTFMRKHTAQKRDVRRECSLYVDGEVSVHWYVPQSESGPATKLVQGEAALILLETLSQLGKDDRAAVEMRFVHGLKLQEIADEMEITPKEVTRRIVRGLAELKKHLPPDLKL